MKLYQRSKLRFKWPSRQSWTYKGSVHPAFYLSNTAELSGLSGLATFIEILNTFVIGVMGYISYEKGIKMNKGF